MSELYTVPAKTNVQAKLLISAFEKGQVKSLNEDEVKQVKLHPELNEDELAESGIAKKLLQAFQADEDRSSAKIHPQLSLEELAEPGTAKKLLQAFESKRQVSQNSSSPVKSPGVKFSKEKLETETKEVVVNGFVNGNAHESSEGKESRAGIEEEANQTTTATITLSVEQNHTAVSEEEKEQSNELKAEVVSAALTSPEIVISLATAQVNGNEAINEEIDGKEEKKEEQVEKAAEVTQDRIVEKMLEEEKNTEVTDVNKSGEESIVSVTAVSVEVPVTPGTAAVSRKNVLVVRAVREETPLDATLLESTVRTLTEAGHDVGVSDVFKLTPEQSGVEEYKRLQSSDLIVFLYRTVLNTYPAALKAWLENVLIQNDGHHVDKVALKGKRTVLLVTTEADQSDLETHIDIATPLQTGVLRLVSLEVLPPQIIFGVGQNFDEAEKSNVLSQWTSRLATIWDEKAL